MWRPWLAVPAASLLFAVAACEHAHLTAPTVTRGAPIDSSYLALLDSTTLPCCAMDSAGAHITTVGGVLTFYRLAHYTDTVPTPDGWAPSACGNEVPSGSTITDDGLVVFPDGSVHLFLTCSVSTYVLSLAQQFSYPDGTGHTNRVVLSAGFFSQTQDTVTLIKSLALVDTLLAVPLVTTLSDTTITVALPSHRYRFEVPCRGFCAPAVLRN